MLLRFVLAILLTSIAIAQTAQPAPASGAIRFEDASCEGWRQFHA